MHAFCLISQDPIPSKILESYLGFALSVAETYSLETTTSLGIDAIRDLTHFLTIRPQKKYKVGLILEAQLLTVPAQHALLKTLEEPPEYARLVLITPNKDVLLPTILSRVTTYSIPSKKNVGTADTSHLAFFKTLTNASLPYRVAACSSYTTKDKARVLIEGGICYYQTQLSTDQNAITKLKLLQTAFKHLTANVPPVLTLEHVALHFPFA